MSGLQKFLTVNPAKRATALAVGATSGLFSAVATQNLLEKSIIPGVFEIDPAELGDDFTVTSVLTGLSAGALGGAMRASRGIFVAAGVGGSLAAVLANGTMLVAASAISKHRGKHPELGYRRWMVDNLPSVLVPNSFHNSPTASESTPAESLGAASKAQSRGKPALEATDEEEEVEEETDADVGSSGGKPTGPGNVSAGVLAVEVQLDAQLEELRAKVAELESQLDQCNTARAALAKLDSDSSSIEAVEAAEGEHAEEDALAAARAEHARVVEEHEATIASLHADVERLQQAHAASVQELEVQLNDELERKHAALMEERLAAALHAMERQQHVVTAALADATAATQADAAARLEASEEEMARLRRDFEDQVVNVIADSAWKLQRRVAAHAAEMRGLTERYETAIREAEEKTAAQWQEKLAAAQEQQEVALADQSARFQVLFDDMALSAVEEQVQAVEAHQAALAQALDQAALEHEKTVRSFGKLPTC